MSSSNSSPEFSYSKPISTYSTVDQNTPITHHSSSSSYYNHSFYNSRRHRSNHSTLSSPTNISRANSSIDLETPSPSTRRFKTIIPPFGLPPTLKQRKALKKSFLLLIPIFTISIILLSYIGNNTNSTLNDISNSANPLHSLYPSSSDYTSTPPELLNYYTNKAHLLQPQIKSKDKIELNQKQSQQQQQQQQQQNSQIIFTSNVTSSFYSKCSLSSETTILHTSLKRGPDQIEIDGRKHAKQPRDFDDIFATIDRRRYYFHADRPIALTIDNLGAGLDTDYDDAVQVAKSVVEKDTNSKMQTLNVPIAYMRTTRQDGLQTIINIGGHVINQKNPKQKKMMVRRMVTVTKGFGKPCEVSFIRPKEMVKIHVIIPYSSRPYRLNAFFNMFDKYFKFTNNQLVRLIVSTTIDEKQYVTNTVKNYTSLNNKRFTIVTSKGDSKGKFSRAIAIREATKIVPSDEIIFLSDADLIIGGNFLQNCRVNVVKGYQVWFPVMFSLYPYGHSLSSRDGMWRRSSYGMACMYRHDFTSVGGFGGNEETAFSGWGSEDVFLYNQFRDNKHYAVLRTLEPGLQHQWHGKNCEHNEHYENCMRTVYMTIGSQDAIAKVMANSKVNITSLTKNAVPV